MIRKIICLGAIGLIASSAALAQTRSGRTKSVKRTKNTLAMLNSIIPEVSFEEIPLEQVMDFVEEITGVNVNIRWQTLEDNGIERDKPISIKVRNLPLRTVLWMIMNEAGGTDVKLAYRATGDLIILSLDEDLGKDMLVKVYDVRDMLVRVPRFTNAAKLNPSEALNQVGQNSRGGRGGGGGGGGGGGSQLFEDDEDDQNDEDDGEGDMQTLIQVIVDTVEPDSWNVNGGLGSITPLRGQIIVRNSILVHQLLGGYLDEDQVAGR